MKVYTTPVVEKILYNEQDVITASTVTYDSDNCVWWPGREGGQGQ